MKSKTAPDPFKNLVLDKEERALSRAIERGEFVPSKNSEYMKKLFQEAARAHVALRKSKRITLRVNYEDLLKVKAKAQRRRIPYQTLLGVVIHQYADDKSHVTL